MFLHDTMQVVLNNKIFFYWHCSFFTCQVYNYSTSHYVNLSTVTFSDIDNSTCKCRSNKSTWLCISIGR